MRYDGIDDHEWTTGERTELDALPRERAPSALARARTVRALHERGLLVASRPNGVRRTVALAAAAALVFLAGTAAGYRLALARTGTVSVAVPVRVASEPAQPPISDLHVVWF